MTSYSPFKMQLIPTSKIIMRKLKKRDSKLDKLTAMVEMIMGQNQVSNFLPDKMG